MRSQFLTKIRRHAILTHRNRARQFLFSLRSFPSTVQYFSFSEPVILPSYAASKRLEVKLKRTAITLKRPKQEIWTPRPMSAMIFPLLALDWASESVGLMEATVTAPVSWMKSATGMRVRALCFWGGWRKGGLLMSQVTKIGVKKRAERITSV